MEPTGETPATEIVVPSATDPAPSRWRGRWWIPVALVALLGAVVTVLVLTSGDDGDRSIEAATTVHDSVEATTIEATTIETGVGETAPTSSAHGAGASTSAPATAAASTTVPPTMTTARRSIPPPPTTTPEPTTTWLPGLDGVSWTTGNAAPNSITACETATYSFYALDPLHAASGVTLSWHYAGASGSEVTGTVSLTFVESVPLGSRWSGTVAPTGEPAADMTVAGYTLTAHDAEGNSALLLGDSQLMRVSPCPSAPVAP